jgi:hypothetical protein
MLLFAILMLGGLGIAMFSLDTGSDSAGAGGGESL